MTRRQGGIGRHRGRRLSSSQKHVSAVSATAASCEAARHAKEADEKKRLRALRRLPSAENQQMPPEYATQLEQALKAKEQAEHKTREMQEQLAAERFEAEHARRTADSNRRISAARAAKKISHCKQKLAESVRAASQYERERRLRLGALDRARTAERQLKRAREEAECRLRSKRQAELVCAELNDAIEEKLDSEPSVAELRKKGRFNNWSLPMVQLVMEQLVNGTPPSAVSANIASVLAASTPATEVKELPSLSFIRHCRSVLRIVGETLAAYRLGTSLLWDQMFTDATSRRQVTLQRLIIGIIEQDKLLPLILSASIILEDETSERTCEGVLDAIRDGATRLDRWKEVIESHDIPDGTSMDIGKLGHGGAITTDTCNGARKTRRLLVDEVKEAAKKMSLVGVGDILVLEIDCWGHLRNIWLGGATKDLSAFLVLTLSEDLEKIDSRLRVYPNIDCLLRAVDKEFSLCANYPKGHGEVFLEWIRTHHPGVLLMHVEWASGSRQDLAVEGAGAVYWNRKYWIQFLDERLRTPGDNILEENLFVILSSVEMIALTRVCSILHLAICMPTRWLTGNCHKLASYNWSVRSMGRMVDLLEGALLKIVDDEKLILDEGFMMGIFSSLQQELPPFDKYVRHMYETKAMSLVAQRASKVVPLAKLRAELFSPTCETNQQTDEMATELGGVAARAMLRELRDESKATADYLSSMGGKSSWSKTTDSEHRAGLDKAANNDAAERCFGGTTREMQCFGQIALTNAGAVSQVRNNGDLSRGFEECASAKRKGKMGFFHLLSDEMRISLLTVALEDAPTMRVRDRVSLDKQRGAKRRKEELLQERGLKRATEGFVDAIYYNEMHGSRACWRTALAVDRELRKIKSKSGKLHALRENIRMRVIGLGWDDLDMSWSKDGREFTPSELAQRLKTIIKEERVRKIPEQPPVLLPQRKVLPVLGTQVRDVVEIDEGKAEDEQVFEERARRLRTEREAAGVGDRYAEMQPTSQPAVDGTLVGKRLDVCLEYALNEGGSELRWCQGEVILVSNGSNILRLRARTACYKPGEAVLIRWDANEARNEPSSESAQRLLPTKWNPKGKHTDGSWRLDIEEPSRK